MKKTIIAALLALAGHSAMAKDYFLVIPVLGKTENLSAIQVALNPGTLPGAQVGDDYAFNFAPNLVVTGDPKYAGTGVDWTVSQGSLPAGLTLDGKTGALSGVPTSDGTFGFNLAASYKTKSGEQSYQLAVAAAKPNFVITGTPPLNQALVGATLGVPSAPSVINVKNTGKAAGTFAVPSLAGADVAQFAATSTCSNVPVNGSCAVSVTWTPAADTATATMVLNGSTYTFAGSMTKYATWDPANSGPGYTLSNNNLTVTNLGNLSGGSRATVGKSAGKWYWEVTLEPGRDRTAIIGIVKSNYGMSTPSGCFGCNLTFAPSYRGVYPFSTDMAIGWNNTGPATKDFSGTTLASKGGLFGDTYGFALDASAQTLTIYYTPPGGSCLSHPIMQFTNFGATTWYPAVSTGGRDWVVTANFGARAFKCPAPAGYQPLK